MDHVGHHADRVAEHFLALHAQMADRLGGRRAAVDVELGAVAPVRAQMRGNHAGRGERCRRSPAPRARSRPPRRRTGRRSCGRPNRGCAKRSRPRSPARAYASRSAGTCRPSSPRRRNRSTPPADRRRRHRHAEMGLDLRGDGGKGIVGRRGRDNDEVDIGGLEARTAPSAACAAFVGQRRGRLALRRRYGAGVMPVRWTIHSSEVSTIPPVRALVTTRSGSAAPTPRTQERIEAKVIGGHGSTADGG